MASPTFHKTGEDDQTTRGSSRYGGSNHQQSGSRGEGEGKRAGRRRRTVSVVALDNDEVSTYYDEPLSDDLYRSTVCMDEHVLSRMEEDLRRLDMRKANPASAIPDRGQLYEEELEICLAAHTPLRGQRRSYSSTPHSEKRATGPYHLPPISPLYGVPQSPSKSGRNSACNSPSRQGCNVNRSVSRRSSVDEDDGTAEFIRRERERDVRRRLRRSQEEDQHRHSGRTSRSGSSAGPRSGDSGASRKKLNYDEATSTAERAGERNGRKTKENGGR